MIRLTFKMDNYSDSDVNLIQFNVEVLLNIYNGCLGNSLDNCLDNH